MKKMLKYCCMSLIAVFSFKFSSAQMTSPSETARQAKEEMKAEKGRAKERKERAKEVKKDQEKGDTKAKYAWHFKKRKKSKEHGRRREIAKREFE
jgi:hypothetical protein